jgi:4-hydroxybenzoate polyprenyltransferase
MLQVNNMKTFVAFLKLIRSINLVFIVATQCLFYYVIIYTPLMSVDIKPEFNFINFGLLCIASVCIAAAGNIINDYFDINIDHINKPQKIVVDKIISRRWVIFWHLCLSLIGICCSFYVSYNIKQPWLVVANSICVLLLFIYSASLKKQFLVGNILVSALTAWVIIVLVLPEYSLHGVEINHNLQYDKILRIGILYAIFSFIISLIREIIKDIEDTEGDKRNNCKTMPIVWGIRVTKGFVQILIVLLASSLAIIQFYVLRFGWYASIGYCFIAIILPLIILSIRLQKAKAIKDFTQLSGLVKLIMLSGICSLFFFWYYG